MKQLKLWITGFPNGQSMIVEVIEERKDKPGYFYIRKPNGGTDTTNSDFLFNIPKKIDELNHIIEKCFDDACAPTGKIRKSTAKLLMNHQSLK